MLEAAHQHSPRAHLEAHGYAFGPSRYPHCLKLTRNGQSFDLDAGEIDALDRALVSGQHDAHCAVPRRLQFEGLLAEMAATIAAAGRG